MAKYVCDFSEVTRVGNELCSLAEDLKSYVNNYDSKVQGDLSSWNGTAKSAFIGQCSAQIDIANSNAEMLNELGEFIIKAAQSIKQLEDELSSLDI